MRTWAPEIRVYGLWSMAVELGVERYEEEWSLRFYTRSGTLTTVAIAAVATWSRNLRRRRSLEGGMRNRGDTKCGIGWSPMP